MIDISVIIPVYNVEEYLKDCLDSICNQSFKNIEIICVNDGSTDNSANILDEYASKDDRIKVLSQANQGLAASRNNGLVEAKGNYIYFIDSDDYLELDALEKLYNNAVTNDSDVVLFKFQNVGEGKNVHKRKVEFKIDDVFGDIDYDNFTFTYHDAKKHVLNTGYSACHKFYKKEFIDGIDFTFPVGLNFEDIPVHVKVMLNAKRISFVPGFLYNYRINPNSILNSTANGFHMFEIVDLVEDYLRENDYYEDFENEFIFFKIAQILVFMISEKSEDYFQKAKEEFSKITIKDESTLKKYAVDEYYIVLGADNYIEYLIAHYERREKIFKKKNKKLKRQLSKSKINKLINKSNHFLKIIKK